MSRRSMIILGTVAILVIVGVFTVAAQNDTTTVSCPGMMHSRHSMMMGGGFGNGMMMDDDADTMLAAAAKVLGIDPTELVAKLHGGQTLAQIAEVQGVKEQAIYDAMLAQAKEHLDAQVTAGTLTQAQADAHLQWMQDHIAAMPMFGSGAGACAGLNNMPGTGMMGRGMMGMGMSQRGRGMMGYNS